VQEKAGQVLMIGTSIASPATLADTMRQYHLGGVFLSGHTTLSAATLSQSIASLQGTARVAGDLPVQVALDQEGGEVQSLRGTDFPTIPSAVQQGELSPSALRTQTTDWAQRLAHAGVSLDLAPVADIVPAGTADLNPPIGQLDRQFGSTPAAVAQDVSTVVTAAQAAGVLTTLKHFPGLGRVRENTDKSTKAVDNTTTVTDPSLDPFASGIHAGTAAVMISSATYPKLDPHSIATFSSAIVTGLLRQRLGFTGLIIGGRAEHRPRRAARGALHPGRGRHGADRQVQRRRADGGRARRRRAGIRRVRGPAERGRAAGRREQGPGRPGELPRQRLRAEGCAAPAPPVTRSRRRSRFRPRPRSRFRPGRGPRTRAR
jgi:hypothetical protein